MFPLFIISALMIGTGLIAHKDTSTRHTPMDTLPKYRYFLRIDMSKAQIGDAFYVIDSIMQTYGTDMLNSQSMKAKQLSSAYIQYLWSNMEVDSVLIETKPVVKKGGK